MPHRPAPEPSRPNPQTLASLSAAGYTFGAACSACMRNVEADMAVLIERFGADALVRDVIGRMTCAKCGGRVEMQVMPKGWSTRRYNSDPGAVGE